MKVTNHVTLALEEVADEDKLRAMAVVGLSQAQVGRGVRM